MLRRLHPEQPDSFAFTPANQAWAEAQITKYPEGRQASAVIPLLWRAQEQEGWLTRPAIEAVADMLGMAYIRVLEVATFYFMFQLQPVGSVAHVQVCGTLSCMICGAEDLMAVCREKIAPKPHQLSADGKFSWEEVECLGACSNAPMVQMGKDYYEDLTADRFAEILDDLAAGKVPVPGPQNGRYAAEPKSGLTSLSAHDSGRTQYNASAQLAVDIGDTVKRIDGTEVPLLTPWQTGASAKPETPKAKPKAKPAPKPEAKVEDAAPSEGTKPEALTEAREGGADNLKEIKGVGPKLEALLNTLGFFHFDQIANWTAAEVAWVDQNLEGFKGRVSRDNWVEQAKTLAAGGATEFSARVKKGSVYDE
ncbi:NADH-quinone oxidoreductase subunit NuoE [Mesobacterium sp. TK19101]|uniref:NADH-quinone oxidoreductase subunit NuoE n=1 Tax=Mesobacterium hydrothermale TaxID=3111907 RepID=A0ABU6HEF7_9RHOB|nr:NADH-quinone oxidoreductase subunit NuoE [Mesobacterium sp. TK19101]MEC3860034.1 NADH-quinone oxidoreductase subunit NuoE [Mesobacterium sp. TK19101]